MYVKRLSIEDQRIADQTSPDLIVSSPIWDQINSAIQQLDGRYRTMIILGQESTEFDYMVIGGGKDQLYWCGVYDQEGREFVVIDPSKSSTTYIKVPSGQPTTVPLNETIGLGDAIVAAKEYAETGERAAQLVWRKR
jgi:hypothetical protein